MANKKVMMETRCRLMSEKRNVGREVPLEDYMSDEGESEIFARDPEPVEVAIAQEREEQLRHGRSKNHQRIIELKAQGYSNEDVATTLHLDGHSVRRFLKKLLATVR